MLCADLALTCPAARAPGSAAPTSAAALDALLAEVERVFAALPGGRAALAAYKQERDPSLAARLKKHRLVKYRLLRSLLDVPILTRETFEEQIVSDPVEKSSGQMMMF